jgi:maleylpyruvate isomerase
MDSLEEARAALRDRLGAGARWDAPEAPAETLGWARTGTAYFARLLNGISEADLEGPSLVPSWTRRHVVAQVGYQARALTRLTEWAASGVRTPMYASEHQRREEIEDGATLPDRALRGLVRHSAVHLDVEWRDLSGSAWDAVVALPDGIEITARDTPWIRAREIWLRSVDLNSGGSFLDFPPGLLDRLLVEAAVGWRGPAPVLIPADRPAPVVIGGSGGAQVRGSAADLARWITGRGARRLIHEEALPPLNLDPAL